MIGCDPRDGRMASAIKEIFQRAFEAFPLEVEALPPMTLRSGAAVDGYDDPPLHDSAADIPTDSYLEQYAYAELPHLDAASWRHSLTRLIDYALRNIRNSTSGAMVLEAYWVPNALYRSGSFN
jgi:hypothetical protein